MQFHLGLTLKKETSLNKSSSSKTFLIEISCEAKNSIKDSDNILQQDVNTTSTFSNFC